MKKWTLFLVVLIAGGWSSTVFGQGCSQCIMLAEQGSELDVDSFGSGLNGGIIYLIIVPYLLLMFLFRKQIIGFFKARKTKQS